MYQEDCEVVDLVVVVINLGESSFIDIILVVVRLGESCYFI